MEKTELLQDEVMSSYLSFKLDKEHFAINVLRVIEILEVPKITPVPRAPEYLKGVINLRGNVLPVLDTRVKFKMQPATMTVDTCIIVMEMEIEGDKIVLGALVDSVDEVLELQESQIKPSPSLGSDYNPEFIEGIVRVEEEFIMLVNIGKVFSTDEISAFSDATSFEVPGTAEK